MVRKDRTLDADSTSSASTADAMMVETSIKSLKPNVCALLDEIPREIRDEIWRLIFVNRLRSSQGFANESTYLQQGVKPKVTSIAPVPDTYFGGNTVSLEITWTTNPNREQLKIIQSGVKKFMIDDSPKPCQQIKCAVHHRDGLGPQIINKTEFQIHPFGRSANIIRVCRKMEQECTAAIYGENKDEFSFSYCHKEHLLKTPWDIPGFPLFEEMPSKATINTAVEKLFDLECYQPAFIAEDPFVRFIAYIGRKNASLLRDIEFDGGFKPIIKTRRERNPALGLGAILPMYTLIIEEVCPRMRKLTLHQRPLPFDYNRTGEKEKEMGYDYGKMYSIVGKVVFGLPNLQQLQLGAYSQPLVARYPSDMFADHRCEWGKSIEWMKFVDERSVNQLFAPCTAPTNLPNYDVGQAHIPIRSGTCNRHKDSLEHEHPGSYGTSTCTWTVTICPSRTNPGSTGQLRRDSGHRKDRYGSLPERSDDEWKCSDAHGGIRRDHGRILNISTKMDRVGAPRTWIPGQRVEKWWH